MKRWPSILLILLSVWGSARPLLAQEAKANTLQACQQGVATVTTGHPQLQTWGQFYRQHAQPQTDGKALQTHRNQFTVVALTEVELAQQRRVGLFEFDPAQMRLYLMAVPMTSAWRGLGCLRETVMAQERLAGTLPAQASASVLLASRVRAFQAQLLAADHITQGAFSRTIQQLLAQRRYHTSEGLLVPNAQALTALDQLFPQPAVLSPHERGLRDTFYMIALSFARQSNPSRRAAILGQLY